MEFAIQKATKAFEDYREVKGKKRQLSNMELAIQKATKALENTARSRKRWTPRPRPTAKR
jgi:hypothetical protein